MLPERLLGRMIILTCGCAAAQFASAAGPAGIKLDGTLGGAAAVLQGPNYAIGQNLGKLAGGNLFFSFQYFNVATGESALFSTTSAGINNVISRVTGGYASTIDGSISLLSAHGAPNFFFINPSGVTFTANASINVPAGLYVSTADYLKFPDGNFYSNPAKQSTLSAAAPAAFGFLGTNRAPVQLQGAQLFTGFAGTPDLQFVAGDVTIDGAGGQAALFDVLGTIHLTAVGSTAIEVPLSGPVGATNGAINITNGAFVRSGDPGVAPGGGVEINGGTLTIDGQTSQGLTGVASSTGLAGQAGPISVELSGAATLANTGFIQSVTQGGSKAADITLQVGSLSIDGSAGSTGITSSSQGAATATGSAGNITINVVGAASLTNGGAIDANTFDAGNAGRVSMTAQSLTMDGGSAKLLTGIETESFGVGNAGPINLQVGGNVSIASGAGLTSESLGGNAGDVTVSAQNLTIQGGTSPFIAGIRASTFSAGNAGQIDLTLGSLSIDGAGGAASISSITTGAGLAGNVTINVTGPVSVTSGGYINADTFGAANAGVVSLDAHSLTMDGQSSSKLTHISSDTYGTGNAGSVNVQVGSLSMTGSTSAPTEISSSAHSDSTGLGGSVSVAVAGNALLQSGADIQSANYGTGNAGNLSISAQSLSIDAENGSFGTFIASNSYGAGTAGQINLKVGSLSIDGGTSAAADIGITSESLSTGGNITIVDAGPASIASGGQISSSSAGAGKAGDVILSAQSLTIQGGNSPYSTGIQASTVGSGNAGQINLTLGSLSIDGGAAGVGGISSSADSGSGSAGSILINNTGAASLINGGYIQSTTSTSGNAGQVSLTAQSLILDGGSAAAPTEISTSARQGSSGAAGEVTVTINGAASLANGGIIASNTFGSGNAGQVALTANSLTINNGPANTNTGITSNTAASGAGGDVTVNVSGSTSILNGGLISSSTAGSGNSGAVVLQTGSLLLDGQTSSFATGISTDQSATASGAAGSIAVTVSGSATLTNGSEISSSTFGSGPAGKVSVMVAGALSVLDGAAISTDTDGAGLGGQVSVTANSLTVDGGPSYLLSTISSNSEAANSGSAGDVVVNVAGTTFIANGAEITSSTFGTGNGGAIRLQSASLNIQGAPVAALTGITSEQSADASGAAGVIAVNVSGPTSITSGGEISSSTLGSGRAGVVNLQTGSLTIDGSTSIGSQTGRGSTGAAGSVTIDVQGAASVTNGAEISSATFGTGNAGQVTLQAQSLTVDGQGASGITSIGSSAQPGASGAGGDVTVKVTGAVDLLNGGGLSSTSYGAGSAGQVALQSGSLTINGGTSAQPTGIFSRAADTSEGQPGTVTISTGQFDMASGGTINISNQATIANPGAITPTQITITAQNVSLSDSTITAQSTGNVAASAIDITYSSALHMDPSVISTSSNNGNGGPITITGAGPLFISHSNITTSVLGSTNGNGGNITIDAPQIVLDTGAIQANTFAPLASGGTVTINAQALVPSYESIIIGGNAVTFTPAALGFNVVQAAAPDGVAGVLNVTVPTLDLGNSLLGLTGRPAAQTPLGRSLCGFTRGSSLAVAGRGGLPASAYDPIWIDDDTAPATAAQRRADAAGADLMALNLPATFACQSLQ